MVDVTEKLNSVEASIGNTPIVKVGDVYAKLESKNPAGSVKDRAAFYIIKDAIESGRLTEGGEVVEATSGNTGIGLAYVCSALGLTFTAVMPSNMSAERIALMRDFGANVLLTPAEQGMSGAVKEAKQIADKGSFLAGQFDNPSGIKAHFSQTAPEIFMQLPGVDYVVCGVGSGGTAMGIKKYILENALPTKVIAVEPAESPLMSKGIAGAHLIQGIGANFLPSIVDTACFDEIVSVKGDMAMRAVKDIFVLCGEKCGISSGAAFVAARDVKKAHPQATVLAIFPDGGDRYPQSLYE